MTDEDEEDTAEQVGAAPAFSRSVQRPDQRRSAAGITGPGTDQL
ncbi:hypothetical protein ACQPZP_41265 [Spirillospora sp. CA-142024]